MDTNFFHNSLNMSSGKGLKDEGLPDLNPLQHVMVERERKGKQNKPEVKKASMAMLGEI